MRNSEAGRPFQRWIAVALFSALTLVLLAGAALRLDAGPTGAAAQLKTAVMAVFLGLAIVAAYTFPIHIGYHTKVVMTTVPLFLATVLLPLPVAVFTATSAIFAGELLVRRERGNLPIDVVITTVRWLVVVLVAGLIANAVAAGARPEGALTAALLAAAAALFVGDTLSAALHIAAVSHEPYGTVLRLLLREGAVLELVQYVAGLLGAFAAPQHFWSPVLLLLPIAVIYVAFKNSKELQDGTRQILESMADAVDLRDPDTGGHSRRVGVLCAATLRQLGLSGPEADLIVSAARVHDIGKIGIPDAILRKPGRLDPDELKIMQAHAPIGADMLVRYRDFARGAEFVRHHHERWDGRGYPAGLAAADIPFGARLIAVADSYDAMTSGRPYRGALAPAAAADILRAGRGTQWDPSVVDAFIVAIGDRLTQPAAEARAAPMGPAQLSAKPANR